MNENSVNKAPQTSTPEFSLDDPTVIKALEITAQKGKWSTVLLQTYLGKNNIYMGNLAIWAEENHLIAPINGNKPRLIYFSSVSDAIDIINKTKTQSKSLSVEQLDNTKMLLSVNPSTTLANKQYLEYIIATKQTIDPSCSADMCHFVDACVAILGYYYALRYESEFKPPFRILTFDEYGYEEIYKKVYDRKIALHFFACLNKIAFENFELLDLHPGFAQLISEEETSILRAWFFIKKIGPEKSFEMIKQILNCNNLEKQNALLNRLNIFIDNLITDGYYLFTISDAYCSDIEDRARFTYQFRYLTLLHFDDSDHEKIIKKISKFKTRQLARYAEQISLYFTNYIFQLDKLPLKNIFDCAVHVYKNIPVEGNNENNLRMLYISTAFILAYSLKYNFCLNKYDNNYANFIYEIFYSKVGSVWPIKNRNRISFNSIIDEEIFDLSAKMISFDFEIENHDPEFAQFLKENIVFDELYEEYWFISFLLRNSDLELYSDELLDKFICEIRCDEIVPKDELMDKLCLLFAGNGDKLLDEFFKDNSPLQQFGSKFFEKLLEYADETTFDSLLINILTKFEMVEKICDKSTLYRIFVQTCCSSYKLTDLNLLYQFATILSTKNLFSDTNIKKAHTTFTTYAT